MRVCTPVYEYRRREFDTVYIHKYTSGRWNLQQLLAPVWIDIIYLSFLNKNAGRRDLSIYLQHFLYYI